MMKLLSIILGVTLLGSALAVCAQGNASSKVACAGDPPKSLVPDDSNSKARRTNAGPDRAEWERRLKNMTPEEREAKRKELKERLEKRIAELHAKQTNATITPQETRELERREQILKRFEQPPVGGVKTKDGGATNPPTPPSNQ